MKRILLEVVRKPFVSTMVAHLKKRVPLTNEGAGLVGQLIALGWIYGAHDALFCPGVVAAEIDDSVEVRRLAYSALRETVKEHLGFEPCSEFLETMMVTENMVPICRLDVRGESFYHTRN